MLEKITRNVISENGIVANISKVKDIMDIINYGVISIPALVINEKVVVKGRVPSAKEIKKIY